MKNNIIIAIVCLMIAIPGHNFVLFAIELMLYIFLVIYYFKTIKI